MRVILLLQFLFIYCIASIYEEEYYDNDNINCTHIVCLHDGKCVIDKVYNKPYCKCHENFWGNQCEYFKHQTFTINSINLPKPTAPINDPKWKLYDIPVNESVSHNDKVIIKPNIVNNEEKILKQPDKVISHSDESFIPTAVNDNINDSENIFIKEDEPKHVFGHGESEDKNNASNMVKSGNENWRTKDRNKYDKTNVKTIEEILLVIITIFVFLTFFVVLYGVVRLGRKQKYVKVTDTFIPPLHVNTDEHDKLSHRPRTFVLSSSGDDTMTIIGSPVSVTHIFTKLHELASRKGVIGELTEELKMCLSVVDENGKLAIHWAADAESEKSEFEIIQDINLLADAGQSISTSDFFGYTPLYYAICRGRKEVALKLLDVKSVHYKDNFGRNGLYYAVMACMTEIVERMVLYYKAEINYIYEDNEAILHKAIRLGKPCLQIVKFLIGCNSCDINIVSDKQNIDYNGIAPIHVAAQCGNVEAIKLIYYRTGNVNILDRYNQSPLYYAVENKRPEVIELLLKFGAQSQIGFNSDFGMNPLTLAEQQGYEDILSLFRSVSNPVPLQPMPRIVYTRPFVPVFISNGKRGAFNHPPIFIPVTKKRCIQTPSGYSNV